VTEQETALLSFFLGLYVFGMAEIGRLILGALNLGGLGFCIGFLWAFAPLAALCEYARRNPRRSEDLGPPQWPLAG
jgi:hypothetical protein